MDVFIQKILDASPRDLEKFYEESQFLAYSLVDKTNCVIKKGMKGNLGKEVCDIVTWQVGGVSIFPSNLACNSVSFDFMGCFMAKFEWSGRWYVAHIHTDNNHRDDRRIEWINFINYNGIVRMRMFLPEASNPQIKRTWGIITKEQNFYSVILDNEYNVLLILKHIPYGYTWYDYSYIMDLPIKANIFTVDIRQRSYDILKKRYEEFWNRSSSLCWKKEIVDGRYFITNNKPVRNNRNKKSCNK